MFNGDYTSNIKEKWRGNKNDLWRHSLVVMVVVSMSRQMGQVSSLCSDFGLTAISANREDSTI
jgi:hypothetical protein